MPTTDPRIDAYIANAPAFAQPVLRHLRAAVHAACPDAEEAIKWSRPHFVYHGRVLAGMSAFKQHCSFGFWHARDAADQGKDGEAMGQLGRITALADLPPERQLRAYVKAAMKVVDDGPAAPRPPRERRPELATPDDLAAALAGDAAARRTFEAFSPSHRREYVEWIVEAKRPETRKRRVAQAIEWLAQGKSRNWKYEAC